MADINPIRIGVSLTNGALSQWLLELVERLSSHDLYNFVLVHLPTSPTHKANFAAKLLSALELKLPDIEEDVLHEVTMPTNWARYDTVRVDSWDSFAKTLDSNAIDILISTDAPPIHGDHWPRHTRCWFPQFSSLAGAVAGFDEVRITQASINLELYEVSQSTHGAIDTGTTRPDRISTLRTRNLMYRRVATFMRRAILQLPAQSPSAVGHTKRSSVATYKRTPPTLRALEMLSRLLFRVVSAQILNRVKPETWFLAWSTETPLEYATSRNEQTIYGPAGRIWADPFVFNESGEDWVFFEDAPPHENTGFIAAGRLDKTNNRLLDTKPALTRPYHLSYPMLFKHDGELYMLPECSQNRTIEAYKCHEFPYEWELAMVLMEGVIAVDSTLYEHDGLWFLFTSIRNDADDPSDDELHLFTSSNPLTTEWTPHPANPIVNGVDHSRCAGSLFHENGKLYRPAQDCSGTYGRGMKIMEITSLSALEYNEREVSEMAPLHGRLGTHTLNSSVGSTLVDHKARTWRWSKSFSES